MSGRQRIFREVPPVLRKWSADSLRALGWESKVDAQIQQRAKALDNAKVVDQNTLRDDNRKNSAANLARADLSPGKEFKEFQRQLAYFEKASAEARPGLKEELRKAAVAYIQNFNSHSDRQKQQSQNIRKKEACEEVLSELRKLDLSDQVKALGDPPWTSEKSMKAASLQASLDFESLPKDERKVEGVGGTHAVAAFWVNGKGTDGKTEKNFLFKPAMKVSSLLGFPHEGEPPREVAAGRMADLLAGGTGLDFSMPETNLVQLDRSRFPEGALTEDVVDHNDPEMPLVGSLQTFAKNTGGLRDQTLAKREQMPVESTQKVMLLDMMTLNCDRHADNMLLGQDKNGNEALLPIDHGLSFPEATDDAKESIANKLGGPFCATLSLPGAHQPFTQAMKDAIDKLSPDAIKAAMEKELALMKKVFPEAAKSLKVESLELSRRSAIFLKMAVANNPPLTPAAAQVAFAQHSMELLDLTLNEQAFYALAEQYIAAAAPNQGALGKLLLMPKDEMGAVMQTVQDNGWTEGPTNYPTERWLTNNPQLALDIYYRDLMQPAKYKALLARFGQETLQEVMKGRTLAIVYRDQDSLDKGGRPVELDEEAEQELQEFEKAFPKVGKVNRKLQPVMRNALSVWRRIKAAGGVAKIAAACKAADYPAAKTKAALADPLNAAQVLELAQGMDGAQAAMVGTDPVAGEVERAFKYMERIVDYLPNNDPLRQEVAQARLVQDAGDVKTKRVMALRLKVMDAVLVVLRELYKQTNIRLDQKIKVTTGDRLLNLQANYSKMDQAKGHIGNGSLEEGKKMLDSIALSLV